MKTKSKAQKFLLKCSITHHSIPSTRHKLGRDLCTDSIHQLA